MKKTNNFFSFLLFISLICSLLPYIYNRTKYRVLVYIIACIVLIFTAFTFYLVRTIRVKTNSFFIRNPHILIYFYLILISQIFSLYTNKIELTDFIWGIGYIIIGFIGFFIFPIAIMNKNLFNKLIYFLVTVAGISSIIAIYIALTGINNFFGLPINKFFLGPFKIYGSSSIYYESNRFALIAFFGWTGSNYLFLKYKKKSMLILNFLCLLGIILSWSRAIYLATFIGFLIWIIIKAKSSIYGILYYFIMSLITIVLIIFIPWDIFYILLFSQGWAKREILWPTAIKAIIKSPWWGYGFGKPEIVENVIYYYTGYKTSIHCGPLGLAFHAGIPVALLWLFIVLVSINRLFKSKLLLLEKAFLETCIAGTLIATIFLDYNIGGLSYGSLLQTIFLGLSNLSNKLNYRTVNKFDLKN